VGAEAGLHVVLLPKGFKDDLELCKRASQQELWLWPLSQCYRSRAEKQGFVLGFGGTTTERIPLAIKQLTKLLRTAVAS